MRVFLEVKAIETISTNFFQFLVDTKYTDTSDDAHEVNDTGSAGTIIGEDADNDAEQWEVPVKMENW